VSESAIHALLDHIDTILNLTYFLQSDSSTYLCKCGSSFINEFVTFVFYRADLVTLK